MSKRMFLLSLLALSFQAHATLRVSACDYDIHTIRNSEIRYDSYFQNPIELREKAPGRFSGQTVLSGATWLSIQSRIDQHGLTIQATVSNNEFKIVQLKGSSVTAEGRYRLKLSRPVQDSNGTDFERIEIVCQVTKEKLSDRLFDALEKQ